MTTWDAATYDASFSFVPAFGAAVLELLDPQPGERILDLGCGSGDLTAAIAECGADVIGVDSSPEMIARARQRHPQLQLADGHELELDEPVDAVFSNAALHWMTDPDAVLARVRTVLRDGGRFVAEMGAAGNVAALVSALHAAAFRLDVALDLDDALPWYFPTPAEQAGRLERVGFRVRLLQLIDRPTPLLDCRDGAADWWRMFGGSVLEQVPAERVDELLAMVNEVARSQLVNGSGVWVADYVRLRFVAEAG